MSNWKKFGLIFLAVFAIPFLAICSLLIIGSPPRGLIELKTINGKADILYEELYGIPYISGKSKEDIFYALGFSHAADRLFSLNLNRAVAYGTLSEVC